MALPSPLVMLSVAAVAIAGVAFVATHDDEPQGRAETVGQTVETPPATPDPEPTQKPRKTKPPVKRGSIYVEVYNNSNVAGLAGRTAKTATDAGWQVVGSDNWRGTIPASTVYFPPRLERAARLLGKDLGITRLMPAVAPMRFDRLTVILTPDFTS
ncbi:LytR C-terminal domain-containing protein [Nocardioides daejeonensis]|uniref:LytR C-terminal domain-containing protein n=1 Tax=Nocardioides daejeonensis TaxID=1046556 RepID=UPI000D74958D|nr:LytR C-terminal domain-containing protein [Nocardioides daejeonensis]